MSLEKKNDELVTKISHFRVNFSFVLLVRFGSGEYPLRVDETAAVD